MFAFGFGVDRDFQTRWCAATSRRGGIQLASVPGGPAKPTRSERVFPRTGSNVVLVSALAALLSGCSIGRYYYGSPLQGDTARVVEGQTSRSEVLHLFGPPLQIVHQTDGDAFVYKYEQQNTSTFQLRDPVTGTTWLTYSRQFDRRDSMVVFFDFTGIVRGVAVDRDVPDMPML